MFIILFLKYSDSDEMYHVIWIAALFITKSVIWSITHSEVPANYLLSSILKYRRYRYSKVEGYC